MPLPSDNNTPARTAAPPPLARTVVVVVAAACAFVVVQWLRTSSRRTSRRSYRCADTPSGVPRCSSSCSVSAASARRSFQPSSSAAAVCAPYSRHQQHRTRTSMRVVLFFFNDLKNSPFFFGQKKGVLSLLHQKDTQIPMRVTRIKQLRTRNKETTDRTLNLFNKYLLLLANICFTQFCVRFSNPSFASLFLLLRARAQADCLFFRKKWETGCHRFGTGGFEFLR